MSLKIYDILGRDVMTLADESQPAGYSEDTQRRTISERNYIYRLIATDEQNNHLVFQKKMMMLK